MFERIFSKKVEKTPNQEVKEVDKKIIEEEGTSYFNEMLSHLEDPEGEPVGGRERFKVVMESYKRAINEGRYFDEISFKSKEENEMVEKKEKSPHEFLKGSLKKYRMLQDGFSEKDPEGSEDYKRRADQVEKILTEMEKTSESSE